MGLAVVPHRNIFGKNSEITRRKMKILTVLLAILLIDDCHGEFKFLSFFTTLRKNTFANFQRYLLI